MTFLYRASGASAVSGNAAFSDVATNAYYAAAVKWAEKNGVTGGIGGGLFGSWQRLHKSADRDFPVSNLSRKVKNRAATGRHQRIYNRARKAASFTESSCGLLICKTGHKVANTDIYGR